MPAIAANSDEAVLASWSVAEGSAFATGDTLVVVEMEKAAVDIPAEAPGVLLRRLASEGAVVASGAPIALLGAPGEAIDNVDGTLAALLASGGEAGIAVPPEASRVAVPPESPPVAAPPEAVTSMAPGRSRSIDTPAD